MFTIKQADDKFPNGSSSKPGEEEEDKDDKEEEDKDDNPGGDASGLFEVIPGYPEIILSTANMSETIEETKHTLTITIDNALYEGYVGDMLEFILPSTITPLKGGSSLAERVNVNESVKITRQEDATYTCPVIEWDSGRKEYILTNTPSQSSMFIQMISMFDYPLSLFTNGDMQIRSMIQQPMITTPNIIKCNQIEADNTFNLYRSPLPNLYDMKGVGELFSYYYGYFGYNVDSPEFNELIDGQEFRFTDNAFGTSYKLTKKGNEWIGDNCFYDIPLQMTKHEDTTSYAKMFIKWDQLNQYIFEKVGGEYITSAENPLKWMYDNNKLIFDFYKTPKYHKDGKTGDYFWIEFTEGDAAYDLTRDISITIDIESKPKFTWQYTGKNLVNIFKAQSNQIERLPYQKMKTVNLADHGMTNGLYIFLEKGMFFPLSDDLGYEDGTNPFAFLADKCCYTITPRPEACSTLETTYNIRTSGVVIGQNIESHAFALNSIGNTVDRAVNRVEDIQRACESLQEEVSAMKNKTDWLTIAKDVVQIAGGLFNIARGIATFSTFSIGSIGGIAAAGFSIGSNVKDIVEEEVVDEIIRDVDVLAPGIKSQDLELLQGPQETSIDGEDSIVSVYALPYIEQEYKLALINGDDIERLDYDHESKTFSQSTDPIVKTEYLPDKQTLIVIGKAFEKVQLQHIRKLHGLGANSIGTELTNKKLLTAAAVKKLIDNNLKPNVLTHYTTNDTLSSELNDYRKHDDLTYISDKTDLTITNEEYVNESFNFEHITSHVQYHSPAKLKGKMMKCDDSLSFRFTIDFEEQTVDNSIAKMIYGNTLYCWDKSTGAMFVVMQNINYYIELESATLTKTTDELVLKSSLTSYVPLSEYQKLLARVEALESDVLIKQIEELETKCQSIYCDKEGETIDERINVLEMKCKNISVDTELTENATPTQRLDVIRQKVANIE